MRTFLMVGALSAAAAVLPATASHAGYYPQGPWCAVVNIGSGAVQENCTMPSFEVCRREALRFGPTSFCRQNAAFPGYYGAPVRQPYPPHKKHRRRAY